jgi:hypothetical protein
VVGERDDGAHHAQDQRRMDLAVRPDLVVLKTQRREEMQKTNTQNQNRNRNQNQNQSKKETKKKSRIIPLAGPSDSA